jgi:Zn-dependent protease
VRGDRSNRRWSRDGIQLTRIRGIPIVVHPSWIVSVIVLAGFTAPTIAQRLVGDSSTLVVLSVAVIAVIPIAACIVIHELAHALIARAHGLQVSHIMLFAFGGVSVIAGTAATPAAEYAIAASGPIVSLILASGLAILARMADPASLGITGIFGAYAYVNLALALFNLIPAFPMDGGRLLRSVIWKLNGHRARATSWAARVGRVFAVLLVAGGTLLVLLPVMNGNQPDPGGLWTAVIGMFIYSASRDAENNESEPDEQRNQD